MMAGAFPRPEQDAKKSDPTPPGVVAIYILDGRVIATAADFARDRPRGLTLLEAQKERAEARLYVEVVKNLSAYALANEQDFHACERIVSVMKGTMQLVAVGEHKQ